MFEKRLEERKARFNKLHNLLSDPAVIGNNLLYQKYAKELSGLQDVIKMYDEYTKAEKGIKDMQAMSQKEKDPELVRLAVEEMAHLESTRNRVKDELIDMLNPESADSGKDVIMEIRAGTGGLEAGIFAADLFRMYSKYAASQGWKVEVMSSNPSEKGGFKEIIFSISGKNVYKNMKYESGTHRVQRVPETEASGRIHTSAATVAVLPEAEEVEIEINPADLRIDVFRAGGHGGQGVNRTDSAVRITYLPANMVVVCQDERSQLKNKIKAMRVLRARLFDVTKQKQDSRIAQTRKSQVGSGDRSEKIRTYNFPDGRVTDHRVPMTLYRIDEVMEGDIAEFIGALMLKDREEKIKIIK